MKAEIVCCICILASFALAGVISVGYRSDKFKESVGMPILCGLVFFFLTVALGAFCVDLGIIGERHITANRIDVEVIKLAPCDDKGDYVIIDGYGKCNCSREDGLEPGILVDVKETSDVYFHRDELNPRLEVSTSAIVTRYELGFVYSEHINIDGPNYDFYTPLGTVVALSSNSDSDTSLLIIPIDSD